MKVRPLKKISKGKYLSRNNQWYFCEVKEDDWQVYQQQLDGKFYTNIPYFFYKHTTLISAIKALERKRGE